MFRRGQSFPVSVIHAKEDVFYSLGLLLLQDRSAIINHAEPVCAMGPPPYAEVVKDSNGPLPPSYDQAVSSSRAADGPVSSSNAHMPTPTGSTLAGEVYSPPSEYPQQFVGHPASLSSVNEAPNSSAPVQ